MPRHDRRPHTRVRKADPFRGTRATYNANLIRSYLMGLFSIQSYVPKDVAPIRALEIPAGIHVTIDGLGQTFEPGDFLVLNADGTAFAEGIQHDTFLARFTAAPA